MTGGILRRFANLLPVWLGVSALAFALGTLAPGDPAEMLLQRRTGELRRARAAYIQCTYGIPYVDIR